MILARYMLRQFVPPFLFGLVLFSGVLLLDKMFDIVDLLVNKGVSPAVSIKIFLLFLPTVLTLTVPMSQLLACLLTFGRLSEDNEITALRASGLSFTQILWPPLAVAVLLSLLLVPFNAKVAPRAMNAFRGLYHTIVTSDPLIKIEPRQFLHLQDIRLYAEEVAPDREFLKNVLLFQIAPDVWQRIHARRGTARIDAERFTLTLQDGQIDRVPRDAPGDLMHVRFQDYTISVPFEGPDAQRDRSWREMSAAQLKGEIQNRRRQRVNTGPVEAELQLRYAIGFSPLALALLGIPLGITLERGGRGVGFGAAVAVVFLYYLVLILGLNLAEKDALPAIPALWMANVLSAALGLAIYRRRVLR